MIEFPFVGKFTFQPIDDVVGDLEKYFSAIEGLDDEESLIIKKMLREWVSELEPAVVRNGGTRYIKQDYTIKAYPERIIGLTAKGYNTIVVWRRM